MVIITIGIDLAKNVFAVHGVDESGKSALVRPNVIRNALTSKRKAAWLPTKDHRIGTVKTARRLVPDASASTPMVKMVEGQGRPKVGSSG